LNLLFEINSKFEILATDGAPMNTDKSMNLILSVFIGAPSVAKFLVFGEVESK